MEKNVLYMVIGGAVLFAVGVFVGKSLSHPYGSPIFTETVRLSSCQWGTTYLYQSRMGRGAANCPPSQATTTKHKAVLLYAGQYQ